MLKKYFLFTAIALTIAGLSSCSSSKNKATKHTYNVTEDELQGTALFIDATRDRIQGDTEKATSLYEQALEKNPMDAASMYELSRLYEKKNREDEALKLIEKAVKIDPENEWYLKQSAELYKHYEKYDQLVIVYNHLLEISPSNPEYYNDLAVAYLYKGDYKKALDTYDKMQVEMGPNEFLTLRKVALYEKLNENDKALKEMQDYVNEFPFEIRSYKLLAEFAASHHYKDVALKAYKKIIELNPNDPYIHISLADFYKKEGDTTKAFQELKKGFKNPNLDLNSKVQILTTYYTLNELMNNSKYEALELAKSLTETHPDNLRAWGIYGDFLYQVKNYKQAFVVLQKVLALGDKSYRVYEQILFITSDLKLNAETLKYAKAAIELFPTQPIPYLFAGIAESRNENYKAAINYYNKGIGWVVNNNNLKLQFFSFIGDTYHSLKNDKNAFIAYDKALEIDSANSVVLNNYAYYLSLEDENLEKAKEMAAKAVELDPDNPSNLDTYGYVLFRLKKYKEAEKYLLLALGNGGKANGTILEHYGDVLFFLNEKNLALEYWKKALSTKDHSKNLEDKIKKEKYIE
ncbi:MAG: tetratricopeptide repeat protein [Hyphomicrobiales bacterium]